MSKERSGWKNKLIGELVPNLELIGHYVDTDNIGRAKVKLEDVRTALDKARRCKRCGEIYWHDRDSVLIMCDDCEDGYFEDAAKAEIPAQRRDSELEDAHD